MTMKDRLNWTRVRTLLVVVAVVALALVQQIAVAEEATTVATNDPIEVLTVTQQDLDADGTPDVALIECAFATERDRVLVYDQAGDMPMGNQWETITDFLNDIWIFDVGADGTAQLIVDFDVEDEWYVALIYDDINGDGQVSYQADRTQIRFTESRPWHVKVKTNRSWNQPGGLWNANVIFLIDGFSGLQQFMDTDTHDLSSPPNGVIDWEIELGDNDGDGAIDYLLQRVTSRALANQRSARLRGTHIRVQMADLIPQPYENAVFWPLLIDRDSAKGAYFDHTPAIAIDWQAGVIYRAGILGYPIETGYHVLSHLPVEKHSLNTLNWEIPMAYYDMGNDHDGWPELHVRLNLAVPHDPYFPYPNKREVETPNLEVNYSWDQDNDNRWDYKLNLGANYDIEGVVEFPDFAIRSVPYDEIVPWVKSRTWDVAMLVFDDRPTRDSEGMWGRGWNLQRGYANGERFEPSGVKEGYLMGFSDRPPTEYYQDIEEGMRGEYSFQYFDTPRIYFGSFDRQLHLYGAQSGVWNLGDGRYLRYANLDGDAYLDQWREERDGIVTQQVNYSQGFFVYGGGGGVQIKQVDAGPALFETRPPGDYQEWQRLDAQLEAGELALPPENFTGMLGQLTGPQTEIRGATARDYRITPEGFRFILELQPGFSVASDPDGWATALAAPGAYAISFDGTVWDAMPATPAALRPVDLMVGEPGRPVLALEWTSLKVLLENDGLEDEHNLPVYAVLDGPGEEQTVLTTTIGLLPGEASQTVTWDWLPPEAGTWRLQFGEGVKPVSGDVPSGKVLLTAKIPVAPRPHPAPEWLLSLGSSSPLALLALLCGLALLAASAFAYWALGSRARPREQSDGASNNKVRR